MKDELAPSEICGPTNAAPMLDVVSLSSEAG
jgi:hypothetical protein